MSPLKNDEHRELKEKTIAGIHWRFLTTTLQAVLTFSVGVLLARLLPPKDFGLLGMAVIFTGLADLFATVGMGPALIQREELDENTIGIAFLISIISSLLLTAFFFFTAPLIAGFFHEPQVTNILRALSLLFIVNGFSAISRALLARELRFKLLFHQEIASFVLGYGLLAVILALAGFGVWSLVGGTFLRTLLSCVILLYFSPIPRKFRRDRTSLLDILKFGSGVSLNDVLWYLSSNIDYLFISRYLSPTALGLYSRAADITRQPQDRFSNVLSSVLFPAYSRMQENRELMGRIYLKGVDIVSIVTFPLLAGIAVSSEYFVLGIYGENWSGAIAALQILCVAGMLKAVSHLAGAITHATGRIYSEVRRQALYACSLVILSFYGVRYGIEGMGVAVVLSSLLFYLLMAHCVINILGIRWSSFFMAQRTGTILALIVVTADVFYLYLLPRVTEALPDIVVLVTLVFLSLTSMLAGVLLLPRSVKGETIRWVISRYRDFFPRGLFNWLSRYI